MASLLRNTNAFHKPIPNAMLQDNQEAKTLREKWGLAPNFSNMAQYMDAPLCLVAPRLVRIIIKKLSVYYVRS